MAEFDQDHENAVSIVRGGSELAGTAVGAALAFLAVSPTAAAVSGVVGLVLNKTLAYSAERLLSERARVRSGAVAAYAIARIASRLDQGDSPKGVLFIPRDGHRSEGEELFEGVILKARDELEERKLKHLGMLYANLVFDADTSPAMAHRLLRTINQLSYRQIVFLSIVSKEKVLDVGGLRSHARHESAELEALKLEEMELLSGYIGNLGLITNYRHYDDRLSSIGEALVRLAEVDSVPLWDCVELQSLLDSCPAPAPPRVGYEDPPDQQAVREASGRSKPAA